MGEQCEASQRRGCGPDPSAALKVRAELRRTFCPSEAIQIDPSAEGQGPQARQWKELEFGYRSSTSKPLHHHQELFHMYSELPVALERPLQLFYSPLTDETDASDQQRLSAFFEGQADERCLIE